jgi:effector-binding domain-containing protein
MKQKAALPLIKTVKPINFLLFRTETTVNELNQFFGVAPELFREAVANNLTITGPVHWHYFDFYGDPEKPFTLEIALPVTEVLKDYDGKFHFKRTEDFSCLSLRHEGNWLEIPKSYQRLMEFADAQHLKPLGFNRELYINVDFSHNDANSTEIQMGIQ